jgi:hypothetical protein
MNVYVSDFGFARAKGISNREGGREGGVLPPLQEEGEQQQVRQDKGGEGGRAGGRDGVVVVFSILAFIDA